LHRSTLARRCGTLAEIEQVSRSIERFGVGEHADAVALS
jgi:hypothetical protein